MDNTQYETANVVYKGLTDGKLTVTLLDEKKGKWVIWKKAYQSQEDSEPYAALQNFKFGDTFGVSYKEADESFTNEQGKLINFKKRTIYSILPTIAQPTAQMKPQAKQTSPQPKYEPINEDKGTDWDKIAVGKCQTVFLQAFIQSGHSFSEAKLQVTQARQLAELVVYGTQTRTPDQTSTEAEYARTDQEPMPTEQGEIDVNQISF